MYGAGFTACSQTKGKDPPKRADFIAYFVKRQVNIVCIENVVPENHILRDIDKAIDFNFIYDEVKDLYFEDNGRPSIDPVVLFKIIMLQYIFGIRSMRQTIKEIEVN